MKTTKIALAVLALLFGLLAVLPKLVWRDAAAIGIIGSADGPTTVWLAGKMPHLFAAAGVLSALCATGCLALCAAGLRGRGPS